MDRSGAHEEGMKALRHAVAVLMFATAGAAGAQETHVFSMDAENRRRVEVTSVFSVAPPSGFAPLLISVVNGGDADASFGVRTTSRDSRGTGEVSAALKVSGLARRTTVTEVMVPVYVAAVGAPFRELRVSVTGSVSPSFEIPVGGLNALPFVALSAALAGASTEDICEAAAMRHATSSFHFGSRHPRFAARCEVRQLPADWRGYSGVDILAMTLGEWVALQAGQKSAIRTWLALGGGLELHAENGSWDPAGLELGLDGHEGDRGFRGLGSVRLRKWNGQPLGPEAAAGWWEPRGTRAKRVALAEGIPSSRLSEIIGDRGSPELPVGIILLAFGILVGPVNLFYLAGPGRRHRLFVTTPLISVATTLLLLGWILLRDGTGGRGRRSAVVYLDTAAREAMVSQEQISRTGLLLGSEFATAQPVVTSRAQVRVVSSEFDRSRPDASPRTEVHGLLENDRAHFGDWFQSRAEQAQWIEAVVTTRGKVAVRAAGGGWEVVSSFGFPLKSLFWADAAGQWWKAPGEVLPGAPVALQGVRRDEAERWFTAEAAAGGYSLNGILPPDRSGQFAGRRAWFLASTDQPEAGFIETLGSVKWERNHAILMGQLGPEPTLPAAP
jgi:hypothetical protein